MPFDALVRFGLKRKVRPFGDWNQHLLLAVNQRGGIVARNLETVAVRDRIGRAGLDAESAKDAAVVVDVIDLRVPFAAADAQDLRVFGGFNINAVGGTGGGTQETRHAFLQAVLVPLQLVNAPIAL